MRPIELLAPARTADIGIEAIRHGADAVYIGGPAFGARHAACNTVDDIARLVDFARPFGVRVYVTINTLLHGDELADAERLIWQLHGIGVSALIIQDPALLSLRLPPIPLHASTQMDNRTPERVAELRDCGFEQVVLARELTIGQIAEIHAAVPDMPLEVFVHGALCVGLSGRCYASERLYGRSANRGECAQVCRLKYDLVTEDGEVLVRDRYLLSLKDMNRSAHLEELLQAGASSLKIEGRLKDMAYVKNVTAYYRQLLDGIISRHPDKYARASIGRETFHFTPDPQRSFNRGFTPYMSTDGIAQMLTPKSMGPHVATVSAIARDSIEIAANTAIEAGDGLCFFTADGRLQGFRVNRVDGTRIYPRPMPAGIAVGIHLHRNQDQAFERILAGASAERTIPLEIVFTDTPNGFRLTTRHASIDVDYPHEEARTPQHDNIVRQLSRLGDTPYRAERVDVDLSANFFIPSSALATWRRQLISAIMQAPAPIAGPRPSVSARSNSSIPTSPQDPTNVLMYTRHCVRRELDLCPKTGRHKADTLFLALADGHRLRLAFDCKNCQMIIYEK